MDKPNQMNRYSRQIILPDFGREGQQKLLQSKVLVVGAGGLGVPVLQYLTAAGVGEIGIVDGDVVSLSNLHRQVLYFENDIGKFKAEIAKNRLHQMNSDVKIESFNFYLDSSNVFKVVPEYDVIVDCSDNFATRYLINDVCALYKIPMVFASIFRYEAQISVFHFGKEPRNLRDVFPEIPAENSVPNCSEAGVTGTLPGISGIIQANEVIKIITHTGKPLSGIILTYNSLDNTSLQFSIKRNSGIFLPESKADILAKNYGFECTNFHNIVEKEELAFLLKQDNSVLIDVRETDEHPKVKDFPVVEIPLSKILDNIGSYHDKESVIILCQSGVRSKKAIDLLSNLFPEKRYFNVANGIHIFES